MFSNWNHLSRPKPFGQWRDVMLRVSCDAWISRNTESSGPQASDGRRPATGRLRRPPGDLLSGRRSAASLGLLRVRVKPVLAAGVFLTEVLMDELQLGDQMQAHLQVHLQVLQPRLQLHKRRPAAEAQRSQDKLHITMCQHLIVQMTHIYNVITVILFRFALI